METIEDFIINILSGKNIIKHLYISINKATELRANGKQYFMVFTYPNYGSKQISSTDLIELYNDKSVLKDLFENINLENIIKIFFKIQQPLMRLYDAEERAKELSSNGKRYFYNFNNPLKGFIKLDKDTITLTGEELTNLSEESTKRKFIDIF